MEALTFQQMLEQPPQLQLIERVYTPTNGRFNHELEDHGWTVEKLQKKAGKVSKTLPKINDDVQLVVSFTGGLDSIGKYSIDVSFIDCSEDLLISSLQSYESFMSKAGIYASKLKMWQKDWSIWIGKLKQRRDIPAQLMECLESLFNNLCSIRSQYEASWAVLLTYDIPIRSSILLALAKFRELTIEEKKVILTSAVFHGPIDNPPSDYREDWYDDHGR